MSKETYHISIQELLSNQTGTREYSSTMHSRPLTASCSSTRLVMMVSSPLLRLHFAGVGFRDRVGWLVHTGTFVPVSHGRVLLAYLACLLALASRSSVHTISDSSARYRRNALGRTMLVLTISDRRLGTRSIGQLPALRRQLCRRACSNSGSPTLRDLPENDWR